MGFKDILSGQKIFGEDIVIMINFILLSIVYFFGVGLVSIFAKLIGKNFLELKKNINSKTYWQINLEPKGGYYKQF